MKPYHVEVVLWHDEPGAFEIVDGPITIAEFGGEKDMVDYVAMLKAESGYVPSKMDGQTERMGGNTEQSAGDLVWPE